MLFVFILLFVKSIHAQPYHNEWIDYNKTYYKFRIGPFGFDAVGPIRHGIVRIPQSALSSAGLGNVVAQSFQLWTNGIQIPIYISKPTGILNVNDFIEFWGEVANGKADNELYKDPNSQLTNIWSLVTDSSSYFLTVNTLGGNLRYVNTINDAQHAEIPAEKNFNYTAGTYFRTIMNPGFGVFDEGLPLYLSTYEPGEGYTSRSVQPNSCGCPYSQIKVIFPELNADTNATTCMVKVNMIGNLSNNRSVRIWLNNDSIARVPMGYFNYSKTVVPNLASGKIKNDSANIIVENLCSISSDEIRIASIEFNYARKFNFSGASDFEFSIPASPQGRYLKIINFSSGTGAPVLYDITNGKRYIADISVTDTLQFLLQPSVQNYRLVLVRADGSAGKTISSLETRNFIDYSKTNNQGNYLIISNPLIYGSDTLNYVEQYRAYRSSPAGGGYNAKLASITELEDQFSYGIKKHPLSVKNFLRYARTNFNTPPAYVFIIGKAIAYSSYRIPGESALSDQLNLVPTFGYPGSDNLLAGDLLTEYPATPTGRLSAVSPQEVGIYFTKVKEYETAQKNNSDSIENKSWMKNVLHLTGADDILLGSVLDTLMAKYANTISDTLYGGNVTSFTKSGDPAGYPAAIINFKNIYNQGSGLVTYFGHSSSSSLNFSLDDPANYSNTGRYPLFIVNGCLAGNIFGYDAQRLSILSTIAEKYMLAPRSGSIAYLSTSSFGIVNYLDIFTQRFYSNMAMGKYGSGMGDITKQSIYEGLSITGFTDFYGRMHAHQYTLNGDPALRLNTFPSPDYAIETSVINVAPKYISAADDSFSVSIKIYNLGKAIGDSVHFSLYRLMPAGDSIIVFAKKMAAIKSLDSLLIKIPVVPNRDSGMVTYSAIIDDDKKINELSENNNRAIFSTHISTKELKPVFPYNYAIVNANKIKLSASTAYAMDGSKRYWLEIDSTALFNSPGKVRLTKISKGGIIEFPKITLPINNTTYYWRTAAAGLNPLWQSFSFTYQQDSALGYTQSHFYQHTESSSFGMYDDTASRQWKYGNALANLFVKQSVYPTSGTEDYDFSVAVNGTTLGISACVGSSIIFHVFDPKTMKVITNTTNPYGAAPPCGTLRANNFEFSTQTPASRKNAMDFLDNFVANGFYVVIRKIYDLGDADWAPTVWAKDTSIYGPGNSLYHRLKAQGLLIDSFTYPRTFIMVYKKNDAENFSPVSIFSKGIYDQVIYSGNINTISTEGYVNSPKFGPAKQWQKATWKGYNINTNNTANMQVAAYDKYGNDSIFYTLSKNSTQDITNINASLYPYIQLRMPTADSSTVIPYQLQEWKLTNSPAPEGAIAPNLGINISAKLTFNHAVNMQFDTLTGFVSFKNISTVPFAPLAVKLTITDSTGKVYPFTVANTRALPAGDTVHVWFLINVKSLAAGLYNLRLEVNPDNSQPEQYHFNNTLYKDLVIIRPVSVQNIPVVNNIKQISVRLSTVTPNPFISKLLITCRSNDKCLVKLYSISGQLLMQQSFTGNTALNTSSLSAGSYIAEITCGTNKEVFRVEK